MPTKRSEQYWEKRFESIQDKMQEKGESFYKKLHKSYMLSAAQLEKEIESFYSRFAINNKMSMNEARKLLSSDERKKYQMTLEEYIEKAKTLELDSRWEKELENASLVYRMTRLQKLQIDMRQLAEEASAQYNQGMVQMTTDVYTEAYYRSIYEMQQATGVGIQFDVVDPKYVETIVSRPWAADGRTFSTRIWGEKKKLISYMDTRVKRAFLTGEDKRTLIRDMANEFKSGFKDEKAARTAAGRLIMTESAYYCAVATNEAYKAQGVKKFKYIATLDEKTCEVCGPLDGKEFDQKDYQPGVNAEPMHSRCRCHTTPVPRNDNGWFDDWDDGDTQRTARKESGDKYTVPNMTWEEWKAQYTK